MSIRIGTKTAPPGDLSHFAARDGDAPNGPVDHAAWVRQAVSRYEKPLVRYAAHMLGGDVERARDLAQDVFLKLCDQDRAKIGTHVAEWLYTVCRNLAIDVQRKERRMRLLSDAQAESYSDPEPAPDAAAEADDSYAAVVRAMDDLPFNQQEVIRLKFQHGLSYKQISEITSLTVTNVGFLIHTGLKALRRQLSDGVSHA
jgi:RNA polymerase sigma-70 factor (ECF subfamily)